MTDLIQAQFAESAKPADPAELSQAAIDPQTQELVLQGPEGEVRFELRTRIDPEAGTESPIHTIDGKPHIIPHFGASEAEMEITPETEQALQKAWRSR